MYINEFWHIRTDTIQVDIWTNVEKVYKLYTLKLYTLYYKVYLKMKLYPDFLIKNFNRMLNSFEENSQQPIFSGHTGK